MLELAAEATDAGITEIICTGISPCITNLMGMPAADQLDVTEQLQGGRSWVFQGTRAITPQQWLAPDVWNERAAWLLTSAPLAVAVLSVLRGETRERGVMTAETAFEPLPFLDEVASLMPDSLPAGRLIGESFDWLE